MIKYWDGHQEDVLMMKTRSQSSRPVPQQKKNNASEPNKEIHGGVDGSIPKMLTAFLR